MRERISSASISVMFVLVGLGLFYTQVINYPYFSRLSKNNSIRILPIDAPRGVMYDRKGVAVVSNRLSFNVALVYQELRDRRKLAYVLSDKLGMSENEILRAIEKARQRPFIPVVIAEDIDKDEAIMLEEIGFDLSGLVIQTKSKRDYLFKDEGCHLFGYLGEVTEEELERLKGYGYRMRDLVGRGGLEKQYDAYLKGTDGGLQIEVDSRGRQTRMLGLKEPEGGKDLQLTIDMKLQSACDVLLGDRRGAAVVVDPRNGEVLAMASHPPFDPNIFVRDGSSSDRIKLLTDNVGRPLSNKAISASYPPGSVFKIVTAAAGLETETLSKDVRYSCAGSYRLGRSTFDCWKEGGHGSQNVSEALMNSCNIFFYNAGRAIGPDNLEAFAKLFGFGRPSGIDLPDEVRGTVPGRIWKRLNRRDSWYEGDSLNYSIGQGYLLVTPMQVLDMTAVIANKGSLVRPFTVSRVGNDSMQHPKPKNIGLDSAVTGIIRDGLFDVVNHEGATGKHARLDNISVAGKTGTAENPQGKTHAWFTGFAPFEDPKICVVVFLEHGGKGGLEPAEIARGIIEEANREGYI